MQTLESQRRAGVRECQSWAQQEIDKINIPRCAQINQFAVTTAHQISPVPHPSLMFSPNDTEAMVSPS